MVGVIRDVIDELAVPALRRRRLLVAHAGQQRRRAHWQTRQRPAGADPLHRRLGPGRCPDRRESPRGIARTPAPPRHRGTPPGDHRRTGSRVAVEAAQARREAAARHPPHGRSRGDAGRRAAGVAAPHGRSIPAAPRAGDHQGGRSPRAAIDPGDGRGGPAIGACRARSKRWPADTPAPGVGGACGRRRRTTARSMSTRSRRDGASHGAAGQAAQTGSTPGRIADQRDDEPTPRGATTRRSTSIAAACPRRSGSPAARHGARATTCSRRMTAPRAEATVRMHRAATRAHCAVRYPS